MIERIEKPERDVSFEAVDEYIFDQLKRAKVLVTRDIRPDDSCLIAQKDLCIAGEIDQVSLTYQKNADVWYDEPEIILLDLKLELRSRGDIPEFVREQYIWSINEKLAKIRMLRETQAVARGGDELQHMRRFEAYADFIYGKPDRATFTGVMEILQRDISAKVTPDNADTDLQEAHERLQTLIDQYAAQHTNVTPAPPQTVSEHNSSTEDAIEDADQLQKVFENALVEYGLTNDWRVKIDSKGTRTAIAIAPAAKTIYLPSSAQLANRSSRSKLTPQVVAGLIAHEIGTHVVREINGKKSGAKILGVGLDRYIQGEEGLATYREQQHNQTTEYAGMDSYFAIGIAKGLDDGIKKDFTAVFERLVDYYMVTEATTKNKASQLAWNRCVRVFRGTTGTVPGVVYPKDLVYRSGNISHWEAVKNNQLNEGDIDMGKFDPTNERHVRFIEEFKRVNAEMESLELASETV